MEPKQIVEMKTFKHRTDKQLRLIGISSNSEFAFCPLRIEY